jgi:hypothetical protein
MVQHAHYPPTAGLDHKRLRLSFPISAILAPLAFFWNVGEAWGNVYGFTALKGRMASCTGWQTVWSAV